MDYPTPTSTQVAMYVALQILPFVHLLLACVATAVMLKRRRELSSALVIVASLVAWLVPLVGPTSVLVGLRRSRGILT